MTGQYWILLLVLVVVAATVRGSFAFTVLYLLMGAYLLGRLWLAYSQKKVSARRVLQPYAFWGEDIPVRLEFENAGFVPVPWLQAQESMPVNLATAREMKRVLALGPRGRHTLTYALRARKRGCYRVGPLFTLMGDLLGLAGAEAKEIDADSLIVYPRIVPMPYLALPSRSPQGTLRHMQPIFEDPTRVRGKRDYLPGDSLRRVDWKATAIAGRLQVKQFEPSIALDVVIFLNLNNAEYAAQYRIDTTELAIVAAASVANRVSGQRQAIGLATNGVDSVETGRTIPFIPPRKGRAHLIRILEALARVQAAEGRPLATMLNEVGPRLPWGVTLVVIAGRADEALFDELFQARRRGQNVVLMLVGRVIRVQETRRRAEHFGIPFYAIQEEDDLTSCR